MSNAIEVKNLYKYYPGFTLKDISFSIPQGLCCGFIGANGAGKTTTLKAIIGMTAKDSGEINLLGKPDGDVSVKEELGIMFDQPYFQEDWTALDIEKGLKPFYKEWNEADYRNYLMRFELDPKKKFKTYSRGMKMKLAMAVNLSHEAKVLLLDEPTGGLDPAARDEILDLMRDYLVNEGRTILFSTHITSDLERIADLIVYIKKGEILYFGEKEELTAKYCIVRGGELIAHKRSAAIGLREHANGYECLMAITDIGGLSPDTVTERASIEDVVVYMERSARNV